MIKAIGNTLISTVLITMAVYTLSAQEQRTQLTQEERKAKALEAHSMSVSADLPVDIRYLQRFMGRWTGEMTLETGGKKYQVHPQLLVRGVAGGYAFSMDETFTDSLLGSVSLAHLVAYNPETKKVHWYSADNKGNAHAQFGNWSGRDSLSLEYTGTVGGKKISESTLIVFKGKEQILISMMLTTDGKTTEKYSGTYSRQKPKTLPKK